MVIHVRWHNSRTYSPSFGNGVLCYLLAMHARSQNNNNVGQKKLSRFIPFTMFQSIWTLFTFKWLRRQIESPSASSRTRGCTRLVIFIMCISVIFISYKLFLCCATAMALLSQVFTKYLFRLYCTFEPFDTSYSPRTTWTYNTYPWDEYCWFYLSRLLPRQ